MKKPMIKKLIKKNIILFVAIIAYTTVFFVNRSIFENAWNFTLKFLKEMGQFLPSIIILSGLISVWIPKEIIVKYLGHKSGIRGKLLALFFGSVSAGPIYAAFPLSQILLHKGASVSNIIIILSSWAVMKVPMLLVETQFLGIQFTITRYILMVITIFIMSWILGKIIKRDSIPSLDMEDVKLKH